VEGHHVFLEKSATKLAWLAGIAVAGFGILFAYLFQHTIKDTVATLDVVGEARNSLSTKMAVFNDRLALESTNRLTALQTRLLQDADSKLRKSVDKAIAEGSGGERLEYVIKGETNLMGVAELTSVEKLRRLFEAFNEKRDFLHLLDQSLRAEGVQIFIGHESGYQILDECSVVTAPYAAGDSVMGVLGVIGPTRMAYERVIPIVDLTAKLLSAALNSRR